MNQGKSAIGTKRTSLVAPHMSAFGGKADMEIWSARYDCARSMRGTVPLAFNVYER
jgi:hypothetical protein